MSLQRSGEANMVQGWSVQHGPYVSHRKEKKKKELPSFA
jgi:hypothetical protein